MLDKKELFRHANWIDRVIGYFSPRTALNRLRYKYTANLLERKYEGASAGRRTEGWFTTGNDANTEIVGSARSLRNRSRDLVRNNPYANKGMAVIQSNVVGRGIRGQIRVDGNNTARKAKNLQEMWAAWSMNASACDYAGRHNFFGLQSLVMRSVAEGGEVFIRLRRTQRQFARTAAGRLVEVPPFQLQLLEGDFLDTGKLNQFNERTGNRVIQGIEFDPETGKRVGYHLFRSHPGSLDSIPTDRFQSEFISASNIIHVFREDRIGQVRGVPWLHPVIIRLRDFDEYEDAQLVRQKVAALWVAFLEDSDGLALDDTTATKCVLNEKMEPGTIEILPPGKKVTLTSPPETRSYKEYTSVNLHSVASGLGVSYESLTGDFSEVNFSSSRMASIEMFRNIEKWRWCMLIPLMLDGTMSWFMQGVELLGGNIDGAHTIWTPPRREMVDPTKEVPAKRNAIRAGFLTLSDAIRQEGSDPETFFQEYKADIERIDKLELTLDSDPRKTGQSGTLQSEDEPESNSQ